MAKREIRTVFALDGETKYKDAIALIRKEQQLLRTETRTLVSQYELSGDKQKALSVQAESLAKQIELQKQRVNEAKNAVKQAADIYGENSTKTKEYQIQVANAENWLAKLEKQLQEVNIDLQAHAKELAISESKLNKVGEAAEKAGDKMQSVGDKMKSAGDKMTVGLTAPILAAAGFSAKAAMDFESAFAGVRKTVDATEEQFTELETGIRQMAQEIPSSATEIAAVAEAAGQLGIKTENILSFSKAMIDLGNSTNLSSEEAATALAQFANITQMSQENFDKIGSVIVELGNNLATTERDIVNMAMRLAGAGKQVGLTEAETLSLAAALSSVGIEAEAGGSAISKVLINMQLAATTGTKANEVISKTGLSLRELQMLAETDSKGFKEMANSMGYTTTEFRKFLDASASLEAFSKVTGLSAEKFKKAYEEDAIGALQAFIKNLSTANERGEDAIQILDDMGITEVRMRDALLRSAGAGELLAESVEMGNKAWEENIALTKEAEQRYGTTESQIEIAKNKIADTAITIGKNLLPVVVDLMDDLAGLAKAFGELDPSTQKTILGFLAVVAASGPVIRTFGTVSSAVGGATNAIGKLLQKLAEKKAVESMTTATTGLSSAIGGAGGLTSLLTPTTAAIAALAATVGLAAAAAYAAAEDTRKYNQAIAETAEYAEQFVTGIDSAKSALDGFDESTIWSTENQQKLQEQVEKTQNSITELTAKAVNERRAMTEEEYNRLQGLIEQLGTFADAQIDVYQQKGRILQAMIKDEKNMNEQRAQEYIKAAENTLSEIEKVAYTQMLKEYEIADKIRQNAIKLREQGKAEQAAIEEARAAEIEANAKAAYEKELEIEQKRTADIITEVQNRYMQTNQAEVENMTRTKEIYDRLEEIERIKAENYKKYSEMEWLTAEQRGRAIAAANSQYIDEEQSLNKELKDLWDDRTIEVAGAMAGMAAEIEFYGGKQSDEAKKAADGIIAAYDDLPKKSKEVMQNSMQSMVDTLKEKSQALFQRAANTAGGFLNKVKEVLGIHSPSREFRKIAENIIDTTADTLDRQGYKAKNAITDMASGMLDEAKRMAETINLGPALIGTQKATAMAANHSATLQSASSSVKYGDIILPIYINGNKAEEIHLTSEELARQDWLRHRAVGVEI